ncbi:MAG: transposase [Sphingobacteriales bacterium]|nr:transposase [Sphingobacteriales bacterium]
MTFGLPFEGSLDSSNRWVQLAGSFPWEAIETAYLSKMCADNGRPSLPARLVLGALIIKHYLNISDAETILQIQENPYLQYFVGLEVFQKAPIFDPSLFVAIRTRLSGDGIAAIEKAIAQSVRSYLDSQVPAKGSTTCATSDDAPPSKTHQ